MSEPELIKWVMILTVMFSSFVAIYLQAVVEAILIAVLAILGGSFIFLPMAERDEVYRSIALRSETARFAVDNYRNCLNPGLFQHHPEGVCQAQTIDIATKLKGIEYAEEVRDVLDDLSKALYKKGSLTDSSGVTVPSR